MYTLRNPSILVGIILIVLYFLSYIPGFASQDLMLLQSQATYKTYSGVVLLLLILFQWALTVMRVNKLRSAAINSMTNLHQWAGAISPLLLYTHSIRLGHGYLMILTSAFILNLILGFMNVGKINSVSKIYFNTWCTLHIVFSVVVGFLTLFHVGMVIYWE